MEKLDHSTNIFVMEKIVPSGESQILDNLTFIELYHIIYYILRNFILEELRLGQQPKTSPPPMQLENFEKI